MAMVPGGPPAGVSMRLAGAAAGLLFVLRLADPAAAATVTDAALRKVEVPGAVAKVAPASTPAQVLLHALAPGKLVGLTEPFAPEHAIYVDEAVKALPQIPELTRTDAPGDVAAVTALAPGLVVAYGAVSGRSVAAVEAIQRETKVPTLLFSGSLGDAADTARRLGGALGDAGRGEAVAAVIAKVLAQVAPAAALPEGDRVPVYLARGSDGLDAVRAGSALDEAIRLAGGRNVVAPGDGAFQAMSVAEVAALKPAVVIVAESEATHGALCAALPKETRFVLDAGEPYGVLTGPPSLNRIAGVLALAAILHPDRIAVDPEAPARVETALFPIPPGLALPSPLQPR